VIRIRNPILTPTRPLYFRTDFLAEVAGIPASVCEIAKRLSDRVQFDSVDGGTQRSQAEAARNAIVERLLLLRRNSTLAEGDLCDFLKDLQCRLRAEQRPAAGAPRQGARLQLEPLHASNDSTRAPARPGDGGLRQGVRLQAELSQAPTPDPERASARPAGWLWEEAHSQEPLQAPTPDPARAPARPVVRLWEGARSQEPPQDPTLDPASAPARPGDGGPRQGARLQAGPSQAPTPDPARAPTQPAEGLREGARSQEPPQASTPDSARAPAQPVGGLWEGALSQEPQQASTLDPARAPARPGDGWPRQRVRSQELQQAATPDYARAPARPAGGLWEEARSQEAPQALTSGPTRAPAPPARGGLRQGGSQEPPQASTTDPTRASEWPGEEGLSQGTRSQETPQGPTPDPVRAPARPALGGPRQGPRSQEAPQAPIRDPTRSPAEPALGGPRQEGAGSQQPEPPPQRTALAATLDARPETSAPGDPRWGDGSQPVPQAPRVPPAATRDARPDPSSPDASPRLGSAQAADSMTFQHLRTRPSFLAAQVRGGGRSSFETEPLAQPHQLRTQDAPNDEASALDAGKIHVADGIAEPPVALLVEDEPLSDGSSSRAGCPDYELREKPTIVGEMQAADDGKPPAALAVDGLLTADEENLPAPSAEALPAVFETLAAADEILPPATPCSNLELSEEPTGIVDVMHRMLSRRKTAPEQVPVEVVQSVTITVAAEIVLEPPSTPSVALALLALATGGAGEKNEMEWD